MSNGAGFRAAATSLWFRLSTLAIIALAFCEALALSGGKAQGWTFYLTPAEVTFEVVVRLIAAALAGIVLGTVCTAVVAPLLWFFKSSLDRLVEWVTKGAVFLTIFLLCRYALEILIKWWYSWSAHRAVYDKLLLWGLFLGFAIALCLPRARRTVVTSLDGLLGEKMTRRTAITTVAGTAALVAVEFALGRSVSTVKAALPLQRRKSNLLLITFDALSAEDMSIYGYKLPTTPNIDAFARKATVFTNFFSASTFTTPSVATILTGLYPSQSHVYQLQGSLSAEKARTSLPAAMRAAGFATGAFLTNPFAYYLAKGGLQNSYDFLPEPTFQQGGLQHLWNVTTPLHQNSGFGSRLDEYIDLESVWNSVGRLPGNLSMRYRPAMTFEQAREALKTLPDGFFLWVHVITPHNPYLPDPQDRGRFLPVDELQGHGDESELLWKPHYPSDQQSQVERHRLLYDEFILTADRAFGAFMSDLEDRGKLSNTTVVVSADHGESFEGGVYQHSSPYQTRPVIHVPLIIRMPGQEDSRTVAFTADQTSLAPTILELTGQPQPDWMRGQSLAKWLNGNGQGEGGGQAFCQYFEKNSVFKPLHHGTAGVIDGKSRQQYVLDLDTEKGSLRPLNEAQIWNLDRSAENPALAEQLRAEIYSRFPELVQKPA